MATERTIPSHATYVQDFGLNVTPPPAIRNKRVVILGTSEDGPMYEPIQIEKPEDAEFVWGRLGAGDLVRGIYECWDVQTGYPTIVGVRIGDGDKAKLEIAELEGTGQDAHRATTYTALKLEAREPGQIYNQVTVGYNENREIAIYNPKTGVTSTFTVDTEHPTNPNVQAHNVAELVDVINSTPNLNRIIEASFEPLVADYEVMISGTSDGVENSSSKVKIYLQEILNYVTTSGFMISNPLNDDETATNNLIEFETIEAVSISEWEHIECKGKTVNKLSLSPLDGKGTSSWDTIQALKDYDDDNEWITDPSGSVTSEFVYKLDNEFCEGGASDLGTELSGIAGTNKFRVECALPLDDSEESSNSGVASGYIAARLATTYSAFSSDWTQATCSGIEPKEVDGINVRPSGHIVVEVSTDDDPHGYWQPLPYSTSTGVYMESYDLGTQKATFAIGPNATGVPVMRTLIGESGVIQEGLYLRVSAYSIKGFLGEVENLNSLDSDVSGAISQYFVRGQEILFNKAPQYDVIVNYGTRINYEIGSTAEIEDANDIAVSFTTPDLLPGPGGNSLSDSKASYLRFRYSYMPNFPAITTAAKALSGGTNGNDLTGLKRWEELETAYSNLRNYEAGLWVPMGAYIDSVTMRYNPITGLKEEVPVGFHTQLEDFLEDLSINSLQPHAILGISPMETVTQANKDEWVDKLTVVDSSDPNRAANIMQTIENKFMSVVAFEPIFLNIGRGRPYTANGQAAYAGLLASIPYDVSPTNKPIPGIQNVRFDLSVSQYEALNTSRYVAMKPRVGRSPVVVEDKTAAPIGSDFVNWVTYSITAEAANLVRAIASTFIGRQNTVETRTSLEQLISNGLVSLTGLRAFDFQMNSTADQQVLGVIEIDLILVPVFTIKKIRTTVKLRKNLPAA